MDHTEKVHLNTTRVELEFVYNEELPGMESVSFMGDLS